MKHIVIEALMQVYMAPRKSSCPTQITKFFSQFLIRSFVETLPSCIFILFLTNLISSNLLLFLYASLVILLRALNAIQLDAETLVLPDATPLVNHFARAVIILLETA